MTTRMTLFKGLLVQDSALSVSGIDRNASSDQPLAMIDGRPILAGTGLKGAALAMARRYFHPLPRCIAEEPGAGKPTTGPAAYRRSAWEATTTRPEAIAPPRVRAGVGIRHRTGARAGAVLYDREVVPAGTQWALSFRVDWSYADNDAEALEAEGILGYVLQQHWKEGRCWLGGGAARGLGWCHLEKLQVYRLAGQTYDDWVGSRRQQLPEPEPCVPVAEPTQGWYFRTLDVTLSFGEVRTDEHGHSWGLDMLAIGAHASEGKTQATGTGIWARPSWTTASAGLPDAIDTERAILMEGGVPLLPGSSLRGALRHQFSRARNAARCTALDPIVQDPHATHGKVAESDAAGRVFGTTDNSSRVLIRDGRAEDGWVAARLHMHAEDEFSAGSYGSAKRDAVRLLRARFPVRLVVEGPDPAAVDGLTAEIDRLVARGQLGHLPVGGHKTRGAGWGRWERDPAGWQKHEVAPPVPTAPNPLASHAGRPPSPLPGQAIARPSPHPTEPSMPEPQPSGRKVWLCLDHGTLPGTDLTLDLAARSAAAALGHDPAKVGSQPSSQEGTGPTAHGNPSLAESMAWSCEPTIDLSVTRAPATFGRQWPVGDALRVDEVAFFTPTAAWRAAHTTAGLQWVLIQEVSDRAGALEADVVETAARLHHSARFCAADTGNGDLMVRQWQVGADTVGYTIIAGDAP
jgi:CRISPR/Cas system CSM-associated protein Csm3 (group 7 of RAMP superfamily)